jgi:hypothetical protein
MKYLLRIPFDGTLEAFLAYSPHCGNAEIRLIRDRHFRRFRRAFDPAALTH